MSQDDIVTLVLAEHGDVKERLEAFATDERTHTERGNFFAELADFLIRHEVAERMVLYPVLCMAPGGAAVVEARVAEQCEVADRIAEMEEMDPGSDEFVRAFDALSCSVLAHACAEETLALPLLHEYENEALLVAMGRRYRQVKSAALATGGQGVTELVSILRQGALSLRTGSSSRRIPGGDRARHRHYKEISRQGSLEEGKDRAS